MATDASTLATENWGLNMEICDFINSTAEGGRDAMRAIRKRLHTQMSKNNAVVMYTLTVLETCVKNCDIRFHELVCQKEFINELVRLIGPKFDAPQVIQERVLSLIQSWNDAFRGDVRLQGVCQVYDELKAKGVEFPVADPETMAPILTPKRTVFPAPNEKEKNARGNFSGQGTSNPGPCHFADPSKPVLATPQQLEKLRGEIDAVYGNLKVAREMLSEMAPGKENSDDLQLLQELHAVLQLMHARVVDLIRCVLNEEVTYELLVLNDDLNNVFEKYDRYMANRASGANENLAESNLIELDDQSSVRQQFDLLKTSDMASGTRAEQSELSKQVSAHKGEGPASKGAPVSDREAAEMAEWLEAQEGKKNIASGAARPEECESLLHDDSSKHNVGAAP